MAGAAAPGDLARALAAPHWPAAILVHGEDDAGRRRAVAAIVAAVPEEDRGTSLDRFSGGPLAPVLDAARTRSMFGGRRVVIAVDPPGLVPGGAQDDARAALAAFLARPPDDATLVLVAAKADRRLDVVKAIEKHGLSVACELPKEREMPGWISGAAAARGMRLSSDAAQALADAVGTATGTAERELDKLALLAGAKPGAAAVATGLELLEQSLGPGRAVGAFVLEDALLGGHAKRAMDTVDRALTRGRDDAAARMLLGQMAGIVRKLAVAHGVMAGGGGPDELQKALACHPFVAKKYAEAARRAGPRAARAMAACVIADGRLKSGGEARQALAPIVLALAGGQSTRR